MAYSNHSSIRFPPGTITSKLSSKLLKKPPSPKDWMHQTYMQMVQDVSYATSHYYESNKNGTGLLINAPESNTQAVTSEAQSATLDTIMNLPNKSSPLSLYVHHNNDSDEDSNNDEDDQSSFCHTYTTSSTDCNRKNNIYRFYKEQQSLERPIEEEGIIKIVTPYNSNCNQECDSQTSFVDSTSSALNVIVTQDIVQQNKRFKKFKRIMTKMRMAAEKPFWAIDSRF